MQFDHVTFSYKPDVPLIEDMTIDVASGQTVAIVGPTGAGKTTLVNLLMRFYDVNAGSIRVDGIDIRELQRGSLRRMFGMVLQDTWLFSGTIRENIAYGRDSASEEAIVQAARAAQADHFIRTLPDNYDTLINEEATNLSQGQKQLLTIARAFLADPAILILDEATSSVDTRTEVLIQEAMGHLMRGRTTFVIAHRLSTIRNADLILMMEHGRIVEKGTHQELLAAHGRYADALSEPVRRPRRCRKPPLLRRHSRERCARQGGAPHQRNLAAVVLHVDEAPRELIDVDAAACRASSARARRPCRACSRTRPIAPSLSLGSNFCCAGQLEMIRVHSGSFRSMNRLYSPAGTVVLPNINGTSVLRRVLSWRRRARPVARGIRGRRRRWRPCRSWRRIRTGHGRARADGHR